MKNGWIVSGSGPQLKPVEVRLPRSENGSDGGHCSETVYESYESARDEALGILRNDVERHLAQIGRLASDEFRDACTLPPLQAWCSDCCSRRCVVSATSQKRAIELSGETRHAFNKWWRPCTGVWWYEMAHEEGVWLKMGEDDGEFVRVLNCAEGREIAEHALVEYRQMSDGDLLSLAPKKAKYTEETSRGVSYTVFVAIGRDSMNGLVDINVEVDDHWGWRTHGAKYRRHLST